MIDEEFCQEMLRVKNFVPAISLEGFETANDGRRGQGVYQKVMHAMKLLKEHGLPFGISACYTSRNYKDISSEEFFDMIIDAGALFIWFFHYMPVGNGAATELLPAPEQRAELYHRIREFRKTKPIFLWIFKMMRNMWAAVLPEAEDICILMPREMWNPVYSSIIRIPIFGNVLFWKH